MSSPLSSPLSRRQWLRTTSVGVGAGLLLPEPLAAWTSTGDADSSTRDSLEAHARRQAAARRAAGPIRLQSNENPYGMSPKAREAFNAAMDEHNKYGSPSFKSLAEVFAKDVGVPPECVLVTQGSREVLCIAALAYGMRGGEVLSAWPTFEGLPDYADTMGLSVHRVPLDNNMLLDLDAMDQRLVQSVGLVFVCNPNNPTGTLMPDARLRDYVTSTAQRTMVLVDEAYHDFVDDSEYRSMTDLVLRGENVIISRTASKIHGLAGLRIGFAIARPDIIQRLAGFATGAPNALGARAAIAAIGDTEYQRYCIAQNREGREILRSAIAALGRTQAPSHTNFIYFDAGRPVREVQDALLARGFIVGRAFLPFDTWVRVSIGTPEEMRNFAQVLPAALQA